MLVAVSRLVGKSQTGKLKFKLKNSKTSLKSCTSTQIEVPSYQDSAFAMIGGVSCGGGVGGDGGGVGDDGGGGGGGGSSGGGGGGGH